MRDILKYQEELKNNDLSEEMRQSILNKIELLSLVVTQRAMIEETPIITPYVTLGSLENSQLPTGLREGGTSDFHAWEADIHNIWSGYSDNGEEHYTVYAGELGSGWEEQAGRGVVFMLRVNVKTRNGNRKQYLLPEGTGWVRISEILGDYIVLASKEGQTYYFYLPGQQFVNSLDEVAHDGYAPANTRPALHSRSRTGFAVPISLAYAHALRAISNPLIQLLLL